MSKGYYIPKAEKIQNSSGILSNSNFEKFFDRDLFSFFYLIPVALHICIIRSIDHLEVRPGV